MTGSDSLEHQRLSPPARTALAHLAAASGANGARSQVHQIPITAPTIAASHATP
jgi:hypothetical protein